MTTRTASMRSGAAAVPPVPSGRDQRALRRLARWLRAGILINVLFAVPALIAPGVLAELVGMPQAYTLWLRNVGLLLVILSVLYVPVAVDPAAHRTYTFLAVVARCLSAAFWLVMCLRLDWRPVVVGSLVVDGGLGLLQARSLRAAFSPPAVLGRRPYERSFLSRAVGMLFRALNRWVPWHRLPKWVSVANLWSLRNDLREWNLIDTYRLAVAPGEQVEPPGIGAREDRSADGSGNDLFDRRMGRAGTRFGRNAPLEQAWPDRASLLEPNPREVSVKLMQRREFVPATTLNLLAAAWIQFQNHGWFNHERSEEAGRIHRIPIPEGDAWPGERGNGDPLPVMEVPHTRVDRSRPAGSAGPPTFLNTETHWWDQSQIYGSTLERQNELRTRQGGKLRVDERGFLPLDGLAELRGGIDLTGFNDNYWVGLSLLHTLFVWEHNAVCDMLAARYPEWDDASLFEKARLIICGLLAKIHTVEWTPGILATPALEVAMNTNWWGLLGERFYKKHGRVSNGEALSGIPGSETDHHTGGYYLTEEFAAVYRLHSLIPDEIVFRRLADHGILERLTFTQSQGVHTRGVMERLGGFADQMYTMGTEHPGAMTLHNFPRTLMEFRRANGELLDLAAIDVLRDRERGVPRYNDFRRMLRMKPCETFAEMTDNPAWREELRAVYGHPDAVDLQVGMLAEPLPKGFGFSDTAFRIFILMASRRLKSDRFFTTDYTPGVYTQEGLDWIQDNTMLDVLRRHLPELEPALEGVENAFAPWKVQA